jgi:hypothetical protein
LGLILQTYQIEEQQKRDESWVSMKIKK